MTEADMYDIFTELVNRRVELESFTNTYTQIFILLTVIAVVSILITLFMKLDSGILILVIVIYGFVSAAGSIVLDSNITSHNEEVIAENGNKIVTLEKSVRDNVDKLKLTLTEIKDDGMSCGIIYVENLKCVKVTFINEKGDAVDLYVGKELLKKFKPSESPLDIFIYANNYTTDTYTSNFVFDINYSLLTE